MAEASVQTAETVMDPVEQAISDLIVIGKNRGYLTWEELNEKVDEAIRALPANQARALMLCREGDSSYEDIAQILGCSISAV